MLNALLGRARLEAIDTTGTRVPLRGNLAAFPRSWSGNRIGRTNRRAQYFAGYKICHAFCPRAIGDATTGAAAGRHKLTRYNTSTTLDYQGRYTMSLYRSPVYHRQSHP